MLDMTGTVRVRVSTSFRLTRSLPLAYPRLSVVARILVNSGYVRSAMSLAAPGRYTHRGFPSGRKTRASLVRRMFTISGVTCEPLYLSTHSSSRRERTRYSIIWGPFLRACSLASAHRPCHDPHAGG